MDDAGDVPADLVEKYNIKMVPVNIVFGTEEYLSTIEMDHAAFYEKAKEVSSHNFPKTSQPSPFQYAEVFRSILAEGETEIIAICVGEKLSGTYASATAAAKELEGQGTFHIFDTASGSCGQGYMAIEAARMVERGAGAKAILERLQVMRETQAVVFLIDSLEYAVKGGRVSMLKSTLASLLRIKPIMDLRDGVISEAGTVRTYGKALVSIVDRVHERMGDKPCQVAYIHANDRQGAIRLQELSEARLNITEAITSDMAVSVAINLGPGALGLVAIPV
jgi:DegV family protein with EDD domain